MTTGTRPRAAALLGCVAALAAAAPADAAFPGRNGALVFTSTKAGSHDIYALTRGARAPRMIVGGPLRQQQPAVSPDGRTVAYKTVTADPRDEETWLAPFDGRGPARALTDTPGDLRFSTQPGWTADGERLLVRSNRGGPYDVWSIRAGDGGDPIRLTADDANDLYPVSSPDGRRIAFRSDRAGDPDIWIMDADGSNARNLTAGSGLWESAPSWSPDGRRIAFERASLPGNPDADPAVEASDEIWTMDARGGREQRLTTNTTKDEGPAWSPDGRLIAFTSERADPKGDIWVMRRDGRAQRSAYASPGVEESPEWQTLPRRRGR
ncbi:PD40 domain-containing protein [Paraconexibacter algicola]|uniref:TolB protein n=1 Tax=Paraconexibacter algicola TaxID=2133960 RepID=A0A2T4UKU7_9ACTN|nr:PD40 domain-containing protein [Paraconexibacter algicola]PTL59874.1 hypothetical protein C7Y72_09540 [Paraconexibacter algicola]